MYSIGDFLTTANNDGTGIKSIDVHYDSLFTNIIAVDDGSYFSHLLIDKLVWDYDLEEYVTSKSGIVLNVGETSILNYSCNQLIATVLIPKTKKVLIFLLAKTDTTFILNIFEYDINTHRASKIFPSSEELSNWENGELGVLSEDQKPLIAVGMNQNYFDVLISTADKINIFSFNEHVQLTDLIRLNQDLTEPIILKEITRNSDHDIIGFYEKNNQMVPFVLGIR